MARSTGSNAPLPIDVLLEDPYYMRTRFAWDITKNVGYKNRASFNWEANERLNSCSDELIFRMGRLVDSMGEQQRQRMLYDIAKVSPHEELCDSYLTLIEGVADLEPSHSEVFTSSAIHLFVDGLKLMSPLLSREERCDPASVLPLQDGGVQEIALLRFFIQTYSVPEMRNIFTTRHNGDVVGIVIVKSGFEDLVRQNPAQVDDIVALLASGVTDPNALERMMRGILEGGVKVSLSEGWL